MTTTLTAALLTGCSFTGSPDAPASLGAGGSTVEASTPGSTTTPTDQQTVVASTATEAPLSSFGGIPGIPTDPVLPATDCQAAPCYAAPVDTGEILGAAPEASGIAPSSTDPDLFFVVDDAGSTDDVVAIRTDGTVVATIGVTGMSAANAEALTPGVCSPDGVGHCLYVGDIGAGSKGRSSVDLYRFAEPAPGALPAQVPADRLTYAYPDGAYNAESLLIADDASIVLITKPIGGTADHRVYRGAAGGGTLELVSTFRPPAPAVPMMSALVGVVATDASRLGDRVLLLTYDQAVEYLAPTAGADPAGFSSWPSRPVPIPRQWQSEGVSYRAAAGLDGCGFVVVSEKGISDTAAIGTVGCS